MRNLCFVLIALAFAACNPPAPTAVVEGSFYGKEFNPDGAMDMDKLMADIGVNAEYAAKVMGTVDNVCQKKGCWMKILRSDGSSMRVTFTDYGFFVPMDIAGRNIVFEGRAYHDTTSVEDLRHYAEDAGKSAEEIAAIINPEVEIAFEADGVYIK